MKQRKITEQDYLKAHRKASREDEIRTFGKQVIHRNKVQKSKRTYDRSGQKAALKRLSFFMWHNSCKSLVLCNITAFV